MNLYEVYDNGRILMGRSLMLKLYLSTLGLNQGNNDECQDIETFTSTLQKDLEQFDVEDKTTLIIVEYSFKDMNYSIDLFDENCKIKF